MPDRASSSTKVAAKTWVGSSGMLAHRSGGATGVPVTFLHGFTQRGEAWDELIRMLPEGQRWITVDLPGHGRSPDSEATIQQSAAEVVALWERLGVDRSHLIGYSMGGRLALWLAAHDPARADSLITIGAHAGIEGPAGRIRRDEDLALAAQIEQKGIDWFSGHWASQPLFATQAKHGTAFLLRIDRARRRNRALGLAASLRGMGAGATEPFWPALTRISARSLLIAGAEDDRYVDAARRAEKLIPNASVALVAGAGHAAHLEHPGQVADLISRHLSSR
jgi:2-succinyl-6-hydroxy-2,4-cyclohexadiene-1-carboxylate synthase